MTLLLDQGAIDAYWEGYRAYIMNPNVQCPYLPEDKEFDAWLQGYEQAQTDKEKENETRK
jgi:ribosome modulation factor